MTWERRAYLWTRSGSAVCLIINQITSLRKWMLTNTKVLNHAASKVAIMVISKFTYIFCMMHVYAFMKLSMKPKCHLQKKYPFFFFLFFYKADLSASLLQSSVHDPSGNHYNDLLLILEIVLLIFIEFIYLLLFNYFWNP